MVKYNCSASERNQWGYDSERQLHSSGSLRGFEETGLPCNGVSTLCPKPDDEELEEKKRDACVNSALDTENKNYSAQALTFHSQSDSQSHRRPCPLIC